MAWKVMFFDQIMLTTIIVLQHLCMEAKCCRSNCDSTEWEAALVQLACHVHASHAELADAMLCMLWDMSDGWNVSSTSQADSDAPLDTSGWNTNL